MIMVSYDLESDRLRMRVAKKLLAAGLHRVQYSVFMGTLDGNDELKLRNELAKIPQSTEFAPQDSIMMIPLHDYSLKHIELFGAIPQRWEEITGETHTLIF